MNFPNHIPPNDLANNFGNYFMQKIDVINKSMDSLVPREDGERSNVCDDNGACAGAIFSDFEALNEDQVAQLIGKVAKKSCPLDPMPASLLFEVLYVLLPVITKIIDLSFESSVFADDWKEALVLPSLKKHGLDIAYKNFRPVSNLRYISKLSEKAAAVQLTDHMTTNKLHLLLQSAYKEHHSTESSLLKVKNDILMNMDAQKVTLLVLLDLSAAFDTVRHDILLDRLRTAIGVSGKELEWFTSYLSGRSQQVAVNGGLSSSFPLKQGVPQGRCLGPVLFTIYTSKMFEIVEKHLPSVHCYADDTQLYVAFSPNQPGDDEAALKAMSDCIRDFRGWMVRDRLKLNEDKTEVVLIGTRQQLAKVNVTSIAVGNETIEAKPSVRNLGSWFDSQLSMSTHISKVCGAAFYNLHNIGRIRKFLNPDDTKPLVHAFITSRIDYCNSLLYGLPACQLNKMQRVLKAAARLVCKAPRYLHVTPLLRELHWLPIRQRVNFKVILFAFKAIHGIAPPYISELISIKAQSAYSLRSAKGVLLSPSIIKTRKTLGDRAFQVAAPQLWNALPLELRQNTNISSFKRCLKTHLFRSAFQ